MSSFIEHQIDLNPDFQFDQNLYFSYFDTLHDQFISMLQPTDEIVVCSFFVHGIIHDLCFLIDWLTGQPSAQLKEQSAGAESTSLTLLGLKSDTEYAINLYPLFPRNSASPATLTARTCESLIRYCS